MTFGLTIAAAFGGFALWALGSALDYRGWGTQQVERVFGWRYHPVSALLRYLTRNDYDPRRIHRRYVRWFDFVVFGAAAFACVSLVTQIVTGSGS